MAYQKSTRRKAKRSNYGTERAREHIRQAEMLSEELGGTDQDVKSYFFNLPSTKLDPILDAYGVEFGLKAKDYAVYALPKWRSGRTKMSGMVAERLFKLLPKFMPLHEKYSLVDSLWSHVSPSKSRYLSIGTMAKAASVKAALDEELNSFQVNWVIPDSMKNRFNWLSDGDVTVQEKLNAHLKEIHKNSCTQATQSAIPEFMEQYESHWKDGNASIKHTIDIGKQQLNIFLVGDSELIEASNNPPRSQYNSPESTRSVTDWLFDYWWVWAGLMFIYFASK